MSKFSGWERKPWQRGNDSLVAVNPERITTLFDLAVEHYGRQCAKCNKKGHRKFIVHHRHYRTVGFEKPVEDIVLLCRACHDDLHKRSKEGILTIDDLPFVDPEWKKWLPSEAQVKQKLESEKRYKERIAQLKTYPLWRVTFLTNDGREVIDYGRYADEEEAQRNFEAEKEYYEHEKVLSFEIYKQ